MKPFRSSGEITSLRDRHESTKPFGFKKVVIHHTKSAFSEFTHFMRQDKIRPFQISGSSSSSLVRATENISPDPYRRTSRLVDFLGNQILLPAGGRFAPPTILATLASGLKWARL